MKGIIILAVLAVAVGGGVFALTRSSDVDLERVEADIERNLGKAKESLTEVVRVLNPLRAINPTLKPLDDSLSEIRGKIEALTTEWEEFVKTRPSGSEPRAPFLSTRKAARAQAEQLVLDAGGLLVRTELVDKILRETQPRVQLMLSLATQLSSARDHYEQAGNSVDPVLALRMDQIVQRANATRSLNVQSRDAAMHNADEGNSLARTVANDVEEVIVDLNAALEDVAH